MGGHRGTFTASLVRACFVRLHATPLLDDIDNFAPQRLGQYPKLSDIEPPLADFDLAYEALRTPKPFCQLDLGEASFLS